MVSMSQMTGLAEALQMLEQMINTVGQKANRIARSVDAASNMLRTNVDNVSDTNRAMERLKSETAAEIGATVRISAIETTFGESYDLLVHGVKDSQNSLEDKLQTIGSVAISNDDK